MSRAARTTQLENVVCSDCGETPRLTRGYGRTLHVTCACGDDRSRSVKVAEALPFEWVYE